MESHSDFDRLKDSLEGSLLLPGDESYDDARSIWNGMIDRRPAAIARCRNQNDVVTAVEFARHNRMVLSIKGGGHGVAGKAVCDNGLMLDMSLMNEVLVDTETRSARVGPGTTLGELDAATLPHGLATTGGIVSTTGVAGLTLGGGIGYLARKHGLSLDNLLSVDLVTAEGKSLHCNTSEHADLFWALRGGGGNFGIVTSFEFQLHEQTPDVLAAQIFYPMADAPEVMRKYRELMGSAPDELAAYALVANVPPLDPPFPTELHGTPAFFFLACYSGDYEDGRKLLEPFKEIGSPTLAVVDPMPYAALQQNFDSGMPKGNRYYWKSHFFREISDEAIEVFLKFSGEMKGPLTLLGFEPMGGAIGRVGAVETAFSARDANFALGLWLGWADPGQDTEMIAWAREFHDAMAPYASGGVYSNYLAHDDEGRVSDAYGSNHERLASVKSKYDAQNFFNQNFNISPKES